MSTPGIAVYAICRNEEANVRAWAESVHDADYVLVCDTGSTDGTLDALESYRINNGHVRYEHISVEPFRFDVARNTALSLVPSWVEICVVLDLDERLSAGWAEKIRTAWEKGANNVVVWYEDQTGYADWDARRVHSRAGWVWRHPVHEQLYPYQLTTTHTYEPEVVIRTDRAMDHGEAYLPLCELAVQEDPTSKHAQFFLGRAFATVGRYDDARRVLETLLDRTDDRDERRRIVQFLTYAQRAQSQGPIPATM